MPDCICLDRSVTGDQSVSFDCSGGNVRVNFVEPSPSVACATLTQITVNGDGGNQQVYGSGLDEATFPAGPRLVVALAGPWMLGQLTNWVSSLIARIPQLVG